MRQTVGIHAQNMTYNIEAAIKRYIPSLIQLLGDNNISWTAANKKLEKHLNKVATDIEENDDIVVVDANFYSIVTNKVENKPDSDAMFDFYDSIFESLNNCLNTSEKKLIGKTILNILTEMSRNYLNFIGELAVLNFYKNMFQFDLIGVEEKYNPNSEISVDFLFSSKNKKGTLLLEVQNLHLETNDFKSRDNLVYWLESKYDKKRNSKLINKEDKILIQPVIWTKNKEQMKMLEEIYDKNEIKAKNVNIPLGYATFLTKDRQFYEHRFEMVNTILKEE